MAFKDLGDWAEQAGLRLPINGRVYVLPPVSAELGPRVQALIDLGIDIATGKDPDIEDAEEVLDDIAERDLYREVLGDAYDAMQTDGVPWTWLKHAALTAMVDAARNRAEAEWYWEQLGKSEPAKKPAKRPTDRQAPRATANRTSRGSTAGMTSPRKRAAKAPRGERSSNTGN